MWNCIYSVYKAYRIFNSKVKSVFFNKTIYNMKITSIFLVSSFRLMCFRLIWFWIFLFLSLVLFIKREVSIKDRIIKFIFIQELLTSLLIFTFMFSSSLTLVIVILLIIKIGLPPFHSWAMFLLKSRRWSEYITFLTILKIIPLFILFNIFIDLKPLLVFFIISSVLLLVSLSVKQILFFSRRRNNLFMIIIRHFSFFLAATYFILYCLLLLLTVWNAESKLTTEFSRFILFIFIGIPPMVIFILKYLLFSILKWLPLYFISFLFLLLLNLFCYFYLIIKYWLLPPIVLNKVYNKLHKFYFIFIFLIIIFL